MTALRLAIADDHPIVRSGLRALLESQSDFLVVGEVADGQAAVELAAELAPEIFVMDISLPVLGGAEATRRITELEGSTRVIGLTAHEDSAYARIFFRAGGSGYVLKRAASEDLVRAIRVVATGGTYLDPSLAKHLLPLRSRSTPPRMVRTTELSEREAEVIRLVAQGHATKEIAGRLELSPRTLETYRARAMEKLGLKTRADIVRYAAQCGWLRDA
jgi:DNA-binding NarL/FixJ family response regulator